MDKPFLFLSYSRQDVEFADRLSKDLRSAGVNVWRDTEQIRPGQNWQNELEAALTETSGLIFVSSKHSSKSGWMANELGFLMSDEKLIIPIVLDDAGAASMPDLLQKYQWADFRSSYDSALGRLITSLSDELISQEKIEDPINKTKGYVFISYAEEDFDFVNELRTFLIEKKYGYWDYAESQRNYQTQFVRELESVITDASATLSVLSEYWKDSDWTLREYFFSEEVGTPVFLLRAATMSPSLAIAGMPYIDFSNNQEGAFSKLDRELKQKGL